MLRHFRASLVLLLALTGLCGVAYPLAVTGLAQALFPEQANGSLIRASDGTVQGSALIGQAFTQPGYFQGRPSAAGAGYDAANSGGSNLAMSNAALVQTYQDRVAALLAANPQAVGPVPVDLVTASASGLDPHISVAGALWQVPRVAAARGLPAAQLDALLRDHIEGRWAGLFGEPRVNVLKLNLALDTLPRQP